ncbi:MAG: hypothetical protein RMI90_16400 [Thermoguttaceae bacterium]|nr:hypothetical protein [Thermoguttaceae bacterium]
MTFAILSLWTNGESSNSLALLDIENCVDKKKVRRNSWSQNKLAKMAKVQLREVVRLGFWWFLIGCGRSAPLETFLKNGDFEDFKDEGKTSFFLHRKCFSGQPLSSTFAIFSFFPEGKSSNFL